MIHFSSHKIFYERILLHTIEVATVKAATKLITILINILPSQSVKALCVAALIVSRAHRRIFNFTCEIL